MNGYCNECKKELKSPNDYKFYKQKKLCLNCYENITEVKKQTDSQRKKLEEYICTLFNFDDIPISYSQQIDKFIKEYKFTCKGIEASLYYFYELMENDIENDVCMGIVPKIYEESKNYFKQLNEIAKVNETFIKKEEKNIVKIKKPNGNIPTKSSTEGWK